VSARFHTKHRFRGPTCTDVMDGTKIAGYAVQSTLTGCWRAELSGHYAYTSGYVGTYDTEKAAVAAIKRQYLKKMGARAS